MKILYFKFTTLFFEIPLVSNYHLFLYAYLFEEKFNQIKGNYTIFSNNKIKYNLLLALHD